MQKVQSFHFLEEGGEMGRLTRAFDWSKTSVGSPGTWPQSLRTIVSMILLSDFPMFLWWGDDMTQFYNDAYRPSLGNDGKHPKALGQKAVDCWPEIWDTIYPLIRQVKDTRKSFFSEDQLIPIYRNGKLEDVYWTFSYSAVIGESGKTEGVLVVCTETTKKVLLLQERELSQERLKASEANLRNMILQAPVAMCILRGPQHVVEIANDRMFRVWGKPAESFVGKPIFDTLKDAKYEGFEDLLNNVYATGETYTQYGAPVTLYRGDKTETVYVHFVYEALRDTDSSISGVMAVAVEVTDEVVARKKLEERESQIRALVESAPFPIGVYVGREMRIEMVNQAIIDVWGKGTEVIGKTYYEVLPELENQHIYPALNQVFTTGKPYHARNQRVDLVVDNKLGQYYFNYSFTPLFDAQGKVYGVMNTAAEVTDLVIAKQQIERSERNFRNMVKQAPVAMCILIGPSHIVEVANDLIIALWGKTPEEVMNKPIFEGLPDARGQGLEEIMANVYNNGEPFYANERPVTLYRNGQHETVFQNFVYEPYLDSDGTILGVLAITIDVTPQVQARQKIEEVVADRTRDLQKSNAELAQFAYIASHDLQEPARKISTFAEMLRKTLGPIDTRPEGYLNKIERSSSRMLTLIRDVLAFSQLSKVKQEFVEVDLNQILENTKNDFELYIEEKEASIYSDALPRVSGIPVQISQLFSNLISNALKFVADKKPVIKIELSEINGKDLPNKRSLDPDRQYYDIAFTDNGIGFNQNNADQIFDIFQRLHSKNEYLGTGIGLAMCKKICENHGGIIYAESALGYGATFHVILP
ncbi:MAG TPA: PAS domain-containing protein, partial [Chryseosolibacter sp.]|nr:PAS domain-containing protein [Chryseosolibacter sp.]